MASQLHLRLPPALHERLKAISDEQGMSLNATIVFVLASATTGVDFQEDTMIKFDEDTGMLHRYQDGDVIGTCEIVSDRKASYPHWVEAWIPSHQATYDRIVRRLDAAEAT